MKKTVIAAFLALLMLFAAACSPAANNNANVPVNNTVPGNNVDPQPQGNTVEPENKDQERYESLYENGIRNADDLAFFIDGTWSMLSEGTMPGEVQDYGDLIFDSASKTAVFDLKLGGPSRVQMSFSSEKLYSDMAAASEDIIAFNIKSADGTIMESPNQLVGSNAKYQIFFCRYQDNDIMLLRHYGHIPPEMNEAVFNEANISTDSCFIFCRKGGTKSQKVLDEQFFKDSRYMGVTFMALRWVDQKGSCWLMPVNFEYSKENLFDQPEDFVRIAYAVKNSMFCIKYEMQGGSAEQGTPRFAPELVEATVEGDSKITELYLHPYAANGIYYHELKQDSDPDERSGAVYGKTDGMYLGSWVDPKNSANTLVINEASPQTGGYKLDFMFGDVKVNGYANIAEDDALFINQGFVNGNIRIEGVIEKTKDGIRFLVTACDWTAAPAGTVFNYVPKGSAEPGPSGGEGSENRDPEKFGFTDWFFPKTWYRKENTKQTLVVTKESLQVGGYKIVFTAPDGSKGECYADPNDGDLVINQGYINGKYRISGYLRQADEVFMRFEITDSEYKGLPKGSVLWYDPKK